MISNSYETPLWTEAEGGVMRPGGLALTRRLIELAGIKKGSGVLDIGCGLGASVNFLRKEGFDAIGVDKSEALIRRGRALFGDLPIYAGDGLPKDRLYDAALLECVLSAQSSQDEQKRLLDECKQTLKPGGIIMISDMYDPDPSHDTLTKRFWLSLLRDAGEKLLFEDHTHALRDFAMRLIWQTGSRDALRDCMGREIPASPGYFVLVAAVQR
ncbi:MAG: class I SAM-dependent methyltransferase [Synergistaceae bacterium]|jgi:SAM-dependent methyltransferase|nr:class I SAM-dependent methyltransferase [Synergistaceae bacterium]